MLEYPVWLICGFLVPLPLPRLGAADLVGARADLGHERDPRVGARRLAAPDCSCASARRRYIAIGVRSSTACSRGARQARRCR
jgi:hypothetical protein